MKVLIIYMLLTACFTSVFAEGKIIVASGLDEKNMPKDKLTEIPYDKDKDFFMFVYNEDNTAFNADKIFFEINIYNEETGKYEYSDIYPVDIKPDWGILL